MDIILVAELDTLTPESVHQFVREASAQLFPGVMQRRLQWGEGREALLQWHPAGSILQHTGDVTDIRPQQR